MMNSQILGFLNTAPIWKKIEFGITQFEFPNLELDSFQPVEIPNNRRLGHQMEFVFKQLIEHSNDYELILYNLPIQNKERTLGEIDFILKHIKSNQWIHVELTYKLYLLDPEIKNPIHRLIGPNRKDRFFDKMEKIKKEQFTLLHTESGAKALAKYQIDYLKIKHQSCFKAQVFTPYHQKKIDLGLLNKNSISGYWLKLSEFTTINFSHEQFFIPLKINWVIAPHKEVSWKSYQEILAEIKLKLKENRAPMIWKKINENEFEKFFVVWW